MELRIKYGVSLKLKNKEMETKFIEFSAQEKTVVSMNDYILTAFELAFGFESVKLAFYD